MTALLDGSIIAFDDQTLDVLWRINVGSGVNAPPMIEIFFRKLLCWPICCGPAAHRADA